MSQAYFDFDGEEDWVEATDDVTPPLKVFRMPEAGRIYSLGVDSAEGLGHGDNSCVQVLDHASGEQCAVYCNRLVPDLLGVVAARLGWVYNGGLLVVEANNHGIATLHALRRLGYKSIFRRKAINRVFNRETEEFGFKTTRSSKPLIITELDRALREDEVIVHEQQTITELIGYVRDEKGVMGGSPFDDRVMALALAHHGRAFMHQRVPERPRKNAEGTGGWWKSLLTTGDTGTGKMVVGSHGRKHAGRR